MAKNYKYVNNTGNPLYLPGPTGGQVQFRPGEGSTSSWFSRFLGPRQLTKVPISFDPTKTNPPPLPKRPKVKYDIPLKVEENTSNWVKKSGIYFCKKCDIFRTGSRSVMETHLKVMHKIGQDESQPKDRDSVPATFLENPSPPQEDVPSYEGPVIEKIVKDQEDIQDSMVKTGQPGPVSIKKEEEEVLVHTNQVEVERTPEKPEDAPAAPNEVYTCDVCQKQFSSERGMIVHKARMHGSP